MQYIVLYNNHSQEWLLFEYVQEKDNHAPNYGIPIANGKTPKNCIEAAIELFGINDDDIKISL